MNTRKTCETCGQVITGTEVAVLEPQVHWNSTFTQDIADQICAHIAAGLSLKAVCQMEGMPDLTTVFRWRRTHSSFAFAYARAREDAADSMADEIMAISDDRSEDWRQDPETGIWKPDHDHIQRAKLRVDARKWIAAKLKPATYGERVDARISGQIDHNHAHVHTNIDASHLPLEAREALRAALLPRVAAAEQAEDDDA